MPIVDNPDTTAPFDDSERFDEPIKINWTGYARSRIHEYNLDFDDDNCGDDHFHRPSLFVRATGRQKTNVVIKTAREAMAVRYELDTYDADHRTWMNAAMQRSLDLVGEKLDDAMAERGYAPTWNTNGNVATFTGYVEDDEAETEDDDEDDSEPDADDVEITDHVSVGDTVAYEYLDEPLEVTEIHPDSDTASANGDSSAACVRPQHFETGNAEVLD